MDNEYPSDGGDNVIVLQQQIGRHLHILQLPHYSYALVNILPFTHTLHYSNIIGRIMFNRTIPPPANDTTSLGGLVPTGRRLLQLPL